MSLQAAIWHASCQCQGESCNKMQNLFSAFEVLGMYSCACTQASPPITTSLNRRCVT